MLNRFWTAVHDEIVSVWLGANVIATQLLVLFPSHLTKEQIAAYLAIGNVVLGPIVRANVTPTSKRAVPPPPPPPPG